MLRKPKSQFTGYVVEGEIRGDFGPMWLRVGIYRDLQQAQSAASDPRLADRGVASWRISRYYVERHHEIGVEPRCEPLRAIPVRQAVAVPAPKSIAG